MTQAFRVIRKSVYGPCYSRGSVFRSLTQSVTNAEWLVKLYYAASVYLSARIIPDTRATVLSTGDWDFLWPLSWVERFDVGFTLSLISIACFLSSLLAFQFHRSILARALFSMLFLLAATVTNSLGGINHPYHSWFWVSVVFIFLPSGNVANFGRSERMSYLTVIRLAQALFLLFYTMTGTWKVVYGVIAAVSGQAGNFSPDALSLTLANRSLQTGTEPLLAPLFIDNPLLAWPIFLALIYIQVVSVIVAFRPRLHLVWGYLQIGFHLGTWLLMEIIFNEHILLLLILLVLSPQSSAFRRLSESLEDLPIVGWVWSRARTPRKLAPQP